jgi:CRP-like cAMP-binding protein
MESSRHTILSTQMPPDAWSAAEPAELIRGFKLFPEEDRIELADRVTWRKFKRGDVIVKAGRIEHCYFVQSGLVALVVNVDDDTEIGVSLIGPGGCAGVRAALGADLLPDRAVALTDCMIARIDVAMLRCLCGRSAELRQRLNDLLDNQIAGTMRTAACNARHGVERRLAQWILSASDLLDGGPLPFTHQQLASLLGVQRVSVTLALQKLEGERAIRSQRGVVVIRDRAELERLACSCYASAKRGFRPLDFVCRSVCLWVSEVSDWLCEFTALVEVVC